jgi:hypothetical protein
MKMDIVRSKESLVAELRAAGAEFKGSAVRCPFHEDRHPSGSIYQGKDGGWRYRCHGCGVSGDLFDIRAQVTGRTRQELLSEANGSNQRTYQKPPKIYVTLEDLRLAVSRIGQIVTEYHYDNPDTQETELLVFRLEPKNFIQASPVKGGFVLKAGMKPWPIYNRGAVKQAGIVVVVEGERDCHTLAEYGFVGSTSPAGAGKAQYADWTPLAGKKVIVWPDADEPGYRHADEIVGILQQLEPAPRIFRIEPSGLELRDGEDVTDYVTQQKIVEADIQPALEKVFAEATECSVVGGLRQIIEDTISGKRRAIDLPWPKLSELTLAFLPAMVTIVAGAPGALKSLWLLQLLAFLYESGVKFAVYELEHDRGYHLHRMFAQRAECSDLLDPAWVRANPEKARRLFEQYKAWLEGFGRFMFDTGEKELTLTELAEWVDQKAAIGCRVIALDPVSIVERDREPWIADQRFLLTCKKAVRRYGASLILVTHPRKGSKGAVGLDDLAGGAAYQRFSQSIFWIEKLDEPKDVVIRGDCGRFNTEINVNLHICKASNARGHGMRLGFVFDGGTLRFAEQGIIIGK